MFFSKLDAYAQIEMQKKYQLINNLAFNKPVCTQHTFCLFSFTIMESLIFSWKMVLLASFLLFIFLSIAIFFFYFFFRSNPNRIAELFQFSHCRYTLTLVRFNRNVHMLVLQMCTNVVFFFAIACNSFVLHFICVVQLT